VEHLLLTLFGLIWQRSTKPLTLGIWALATLIVALAGPFGTFAALPWWAALAYWALVIGISIFVASFVRVFATALLPDWPRSRLELLVPGLFSVLYAPLLHPIGELFLGDSYAHVLSFGMTFTIVMFVAYGVMLVQRFCRTGSMWLDSRGDAGAAVQPRTVGTMLRPRLLDRLNVSDDSQVVRLTVDDHYVILYLRDGSHHRVLMRFADAVAEMTGVPGFHTHRSHWVAEGAVVRVERAGGREVVVLSDGSTAPISRTFRENLVQRGLIHGASPANPVPDVSATVPPTPAE
jgi:hypothetical protein